MQRLHERAAAQLIAVRGAATGAWYFLNPSLGVLNAFPLKPGQDDGPIAFSPDGTMAAISLIDHGALIEPVNLAPILPSPPASSASASPAPGVTGVDWSGAIAGHSLGEVKAADNPQTLVDALLAATALPAAADTSANRALTRVYLWAYDSSKPSAIASISDATPAILQKYPPLAAQVNYDHWAPLESWALTGGCMRYRVVVTGSIAPAASTFGLQSNAPCLGASPTPTPS